MCVCANRLATSEEKATATAALETSEPARAQTQQWKSDHHTVSGSMFKSKALWRDKSDGTSG